MYEKCDLTLTITQNQFKNVNLLNSTFSLNESAPLLSFPAAAEEMFQNSLNMSYIGQMSGKKSNLHKLKVEQLEEPIRKTSYLKPEKLSFSKVQVQEVEESLESTIREEDANYAFVRSISKQGEELFASTGCSVCSSQFNGGKCRLELVEQSGLEIYLPNQEGKFEKLIISLNFDTVTARIYFDSVQQNKEIEIFAGKYRFVIDFETQKLAAWWNSKLQKILSKSKGNEFGLTKLLTKEGEPFYKERHATQSYFAENCETGDILLFQDDHFFAKAQRFFTRSDFDHVGMVIRDLNYGILIFEANSGRGVCLTPWKYVIKFEWFKTIPKITWRRLKEIQKNRQFAETIEKFVVSNLEKHYHISFSKITAQDSILRPPPNTKLINQEKANEQDESGFFCSELVATAYKQLGLLTRDKTNPNYQPACKFYPKDFSERSGRRLDRGQLSHQYSLFFEDVLIKQAYDRTIFQE